MRRPEEVLNAFAPRAHLGEHTSFFLVGIGGAGMSGIAQMLLDRGFRVRGTDAQDSPVIQELESRGARVWIGHTGAPIETEDALIITDAVDLDNSPEVLRARQLDLDVFRRSQALGWLLQSHRVIAITGTHGKTTVTGMTGAALIAAGLDPLVVVGATVPEFGGAVAEGQGDWAVVEACEAYDSLRDIDPFMVILTNLEPDHLDYHGTWENLKLAVGRFLARIPTGGRLIANGDDAGIRELLAEITVPEVEWTGAATWSTTGHELNLPGAHNVTNAGEAWRGAVAAGADPQRAAAGIAQFGGAERRLEVIHDDESVTVIDDYAHHPCEIAASLQAVRSRCPGRPLIVVFQPHLYSRTRDVLPGFAPALDAADWVILTDIYPAREAPIPGISAARIAEGLTRPHRYVPSRHLLAREVKALIRRERLERPVVVGMGAGNIADFAPAFIEEWTRASGRLVVAFGGDSSEREVSLHSGDAMAAALRSVGHEVSKVDVSDALLTGQFPRDWVGATRPDCIVLAVHGTHAEDGAIQGLCELLHLPYTGSNITASALALDKQLTKTILAGAGLPVPKGGRVASPDAVQIAAIADSIGGDRFVVKPNAQGSTVGLTFVSGRGGLADAVARALAYDAEALIEEWLDGVEISVPVLGNRALPAVEILPANGRYDFASKYEVGATTEICPARLNPEDSARAAEIAVSAHRVLGCAGATRTDFIVVQGRGPVALEVNTLPGMTSTSLLPRSADVAGLSFADLCEWIVRDAQERHAART